MGKLIKYDFVNKKPVEETRIDDARRVVEVVVSRKPLQPYVTLPAYLVPEGSRVLVVPRGAIIQEYEAMNNGRIVKGIDIWQV